MTDFPLTVKGERHFHPFHLLIDAAEDSFKTLETYQAGRVEPIYLAGGISFALSTIVMSSFALEGLVNSIGSSKVERWSDFENTRLMGKLRVICNELDIEVLENTQPWQNIGWLVKLRNNLAHAKPKKIKVDQTIKEDELEKLLFLGTTELEKNISIEGAEKALNTVREIRDILLSKLDSDIDDAFFIPH